MLALCLSIMVTRITNAAHIQYCSSKQDTPGPAHRRFAQDIGSPAVQAVSLKPSSRHCAGQLGRHDLNQAVGCGDAQQSIQASACVIKSYTVTQST